MVTARNLDILKISPLRLKKNRPKKDKNNHSVSSDMEWLSSIDASHMTVDVKNRLKKSKSPAEKAKKTVSDFYKLPRKNFERDYDFLASEYSDDD